MATILPKLRLEIGQHPGVQVFVQFPDTSTNELTYLSSDEAAGQTTLSVVSGNNFSANEYVLIGNVGSEQSEIVLVSGQSSSTLTTGATTFAHPRGTSVRFIPFNQIEIDDDTDSSFGSATTTTVNIRPDSSETFLEDIDGTSSTYYRVRFVHEQGVRQSSYSDGVIATGYALNSVFSVKKLALESVGHKLSDFDWLTDDWLNSVLWEGRRELESNLDKWSFRKKFESDIGNVITGQNTISTPSDLREPNTAKNLLAIYIGTNRQPLEKWSKQQMNNWYRGVAHTTLGSAITSTGDITVTLTNSRDFEDSGSVDIGGSSALETIDYTSNDTSTGVLSGVTNIGATHAVSVDVWQNASFGYPSAFTVTDDGILFNQPFHEDHHGQNIFADYWSTFTALDSDADALDEPDYGMLVNYLSFRIKKRKSKGIISLDDDDFTQWRLRGGKLINREMHEQDVQRIPDIQHLIGEE